MPTVNELLRDAAIDHAVNFTQYSNDVVRRMIAVLNRTDAELFQQLAAALVATDGEASQFRIARLDALLTSVQAVNSRAYSQLSESIAAEMVRVAEYEAEWNLELFRSTLPAAINIAGVSPTAVYAAATAEPFRGKLLAEWTEKIAADRLSRIVDNVRIGFVQGKTTDEIVRTIVGTRAAKYSDGLINTDRHSAATVVRTAMSHYAAAAREEFHRANEDLIAGVVWSSTLDSRTSPMCQIRDGKRYSLPKHKPIGHKIPWLEGPGQLHWNCRSSAVAIVKGWKELGITLDPGSRSAMDGTVPADVTFAEWFRRQSASRQREIFGAARYELMKKGGLTFDRFFNDKGVHLTLDEMRKRDAAAFRRAGV